jgi:hypothetical protein
MFIQIVGQSIDRKSIGKIETITIRSSDQIIRSNYIRMSCCETVSVGKFCADCGKKKDAILSLSRQQQLDRLLANSIDLGNCDLLMTFVDRSVVDDSIENKTFQANDGSSNINVPKHIFEQCCDYTKQYIFVSQLPKEHLEYDMELDRTKIAIRDTNDRNRGTFVGRGFIVKKGKRRYVTSNDHIFGQTVDSNGTPFIRNKFLDEMDVHHFCVKSLTTVANMLINAIRNKIRNPTFVNRLSSRGFDYELYIKNTDNPHISPETFAIREKQQRLEQLIKRLYGLVDTIYLMDGHFYCLETLESIKTNGFVLDWSKSGKVIRVFDLNVVVVDDDCTMIVRTIRTFGRCRQNGFVIPSGEFDELMLKHMVGSD